MILKPPKFCTWKLILAVIRNVGTSIAFNFKLDVLNPQTRIFCLSYRTSLLTEVFKIGSKIIPQLERPLYLEVGESQ